MFESIFKISYKYGKTAEIISKVTVAKSLTNPNDDFDFFLLELSKLLVLIYFPSIKFYYVEVAHMMLVTS